MHRRFRLAHLIARIPAIAFALILCASAFGKPRLTDHDLYTSSAINDLDRAANLGATLTKNPNDVVIMAQFSPGQLDLYAQTRNRNRTFELASAVEKALSSLPGLTVKYSTSGIFGMVRASSNNARLFARYAEQDLPVNRLYRELVQKGWNPIIVVEVRDAKPLKTTPAPDRIEGKNRYWIIRSQTEAKDIHAQESVPARSYLPILLPPFALALMIWAGVSTTKSKKQPTFVKTMLPFLLKIAGALVLLAVAGISLSSSSPDDNYVLADAWVNPAGVAIIIVIITTIAIIGFAGWLLYGLRPRIDSPFLADAGHKDRISELDRIQKRSLLQAILIVFVFLLAIAALALLVAPPGSSHALRKAASWSVRIIMVSGIFAGWSYRCFLLRKWSPKVSEKEMALIYSLAASCASSLGLATPKIVVSSTGENNLLIEAYYDAKGRLVVTRGALLDLTESELSALILLEMATKSLETPEQTRKMRWQGFLRMLLLVIAAIISIVVIKSFVYAVAIIGIAFYLPLDPRRSKLRFTNDREAIKKSFEIEQRQEIWTSLVDKQTLASNSSPATLSSFPSMSHVKRETNIRFRLK